MDDKASPILLDWSVERSNWSEFDTISLDVLGDGSGNVMSVWYYDDLTRRRICAGSVKLTWTGWRHITFELPSYNRTSITDFMVTLEWGGKVEGLGIHTIDIENITVERTQGFELVRNFRAFKDGYYDVFVRARGGDLRVYVDDTHRDLKFGDVFEWKSFRVKLEKGEHRLRITSPDKVEIDLIVISSGKIEFEGLRRVDFKRVGDRWIVNVKSEKPFMLVFAEGYDPFWIASVNGKDFKSFPVYALTNGFYINGSGDLRIEVEYRLQDYFYYGLLISSLSLTALILLVWRMNQVFR
jgi:hypothetical protein